VSAKNCPCRGCTASRKDEREAVLVTVAESLGADARALVEATLANEGKPVPRARYEYGKAEPCNACGRADAACVAGLKKYGRPCCGRCHTTATHNQDAMVTA
jgi:deoxycytidylate deaminase